MNGTRGGWHPDAYMQSLYDNAAPQYRFKAENDEQWQEWHAGLRQAFAERLGGFPEVRAPLEPVLLESVACDGYTRERVEMTTYAGLRMPAYVLVPHGRQGERLPAVVALHGHGYGSREIVGLHPDGRPMAEAETTIYKKFAVELVKRGFLVIAPEELGFGDRKTREEYERNEYSSCHTISTYLLHMGQTMAGHRVYETMRAIDYLTTRPDVDAERIGCMGISGGGLITAFAAALDDRIRAAVVSGFVNTFRASILSVFHCVDNYIPGLHRIAEMPDIVALIAPRPLLMEAGVRDPIFPIEAAKSAYADIRKTYRLLGAEDRLACDIFEGEHEIHGVLAYPWLAEQLK